MENKNKSVICKQFYTVEQNAWGRIHEGDHSSQPQEVLAVKQSLHIVGYFLLHKRQMQPSPCSPQTGPEREQKKIKPSLLKQMLNVP